MELLLPVNAAATWFMTGVIWFVQIVHYPLFAGVGQTRFAAYANEHVRRTGWVVAPAMLVEAVTALLLPFAGPENIPAWQSWAGLGLVMMIWLSTALGQVPQHRKLQHGFDATAVARLVTSNRLRVAAWTLRALLVTYWLS